MPDTMLSHVEWHEKVTRDIKGCSDLELTGRVSNCDFIIDCREVERRREAIVSVYLADTQGIIFAVLGEHHFHVSDSSTALWPAANYISSIKKGIEEDPYSFLSEHQYH